MHVSKKLLITQSLVLLIAFPTGAHAAKLVSGPQPSKEKLARIPGSFSALVINGPWKDVNDKPVDRPHSLVVTFGLKPSVIVFARTYSDEATLAFLKKLDAKVEAHKERFLKGGVVFLCFDDKRSKSDIDAKDLLAVAKEKDEILSQLKEKAQGLKNLVVAVTSADGPPAWALDKKADVTVLLYHKLEIKASFAFAKGDLDEKAAAPIFAALEGMVAEGKKKPETR